MKKKSATTKVFELFFNNLDERVSIKQLKKACYWTVWRQWDNIIWKMRLQWLKIKNDRWFYMLCSKKKW